MGSLVKTPEIVASIFNSFRWHFSRNIKDIYLTFDDGPLAETTPWVLKQLKKYNAKATFFCIGDNVNKYPTVFDEIINEGHRIGNHTLNHLNGFKTKTIIYIENVENAHNILTNINPRFSNNKPLLFRPPYGKIRPKQTKILKEKGYEIVLWDVLSRDFDIKLKGKNCVENVINNTQNGSIIVFHDSLKASERLYFTLPKILEYYSKEGYSFKTI